MATAELSDPFLAANGSQNSTVDGEPRTRTSRPPKVESTVTVTDVSSPVPLRRRSSFDAQWPPNARRWKSEDHKPKAARQHTSAGGGRWGSTNGRAASKERSADEGSANGLSTPGAQQNGASKQMPLGDVPLNTAHERRVYATPDRAPASAPRPVKGVGELEPRPSDRRIASMPVTNGPAAGHPASASEASERPRARARKQRQAVSETAARDRSATVLEPRQRPLDDVDALGGPAVSWRQHLQRELAPAGHPAHAATDDPLYEPAGVKLDRLLNFVLLAPALERVLWFGTCVCLDAWLYMVTILPLRFLRVVGDLCRQWTTTFALEAQFLFSFIYGGFGRLYRRYLSLSWKFRKRQKSRKPTPQRSRSDSETQPKSASRRRKNSISGVAIPPQGLEQCKAQLRSQRRKETFTPLSQVDRADLLRGLLILISSLMLMKLDASMVYHSIRGQATIKLYVIYNVLEVSCSVGPHYLVSNERQVLDRLLSAFGQDVLEVLLLPPSALNSSHQSLQLSPFSRSCLLFLLALVYNTVHAFALFLQVVTLNVAVNSHSNALLTLLMSNQFVEIKSTVFKKFDRENLFQITCADIVERFQLALMLVIIVARNFLETGPSSSGAPPPGADLLPFGLAARLPARLAQLLGPFALVLGTEAIIDGIKHAYITKFNNTRPRAYGRFLDVLARDYAHAAFAVPDLTRRLGLPLLPLVTLALRTAAQAHHRMFLAAHVPPAEGRRDGLRALLPSVRLVVTVASAALLFAALLAAKLALGRALLRWSRARTARVETAQRRRHRAPAEDGAPASALDDAADWVIAGAKRAGAWGAVEVPEDARRWIRDEDGQPKSGGNARRVESEKKDAPKGLEAVERYKMVAKRIW